MQGSCPLMFGYSQLTAPSRKPALGRCEFPQSSCFCPFFCMSNARSTQIPSPTIASHRVSSIVCRHRCCVNEVRSILYFQRVVRGSSLVSVTHIARLIFLLPPCQVRVALQLQTGCQTSLSLLRGDEASCQHVCESITRSRRVARPDARREGWTTS